MKDYQILNQIYESANSLVYKGISETDGQPVIIKILKQDYPSPQELIRYKQEYQITKSLDFPGAIAVYSLEAYERTLAIAIEDFGGESLTRLFGPKRATGGLPLEEFLKIAIATTESLGRIHSANVIHKDINPSNIVLNQETTELKIIDFGISTKLTRENPTLKNPNVLEGTLAYISPEQTGRMNRLLDYRTDFYSLGVTFYELLTGKLPFESDEPLELVHCHIAKQGRSPHEINPEIPRVVSNLIMKLMAKTAEERYQSAWGIKADLEKILTQLQTSGNISEFPLGDGDISDKFQIPQKLYGRETEIETLLTAFNRVASGKSQIELILVGGYSGIGKSALVQEIYKPITEKRGYFISGKFDQFQRNIPYSAVVNAFKGLVKQLLTETETELNKWREKISVAVGVNAQVIIDVIPEVELIIGSQPPVPELGPKESQNRFNLVFGNFLRCFGSAEHPLAIFLDDLQWADSASLKLMELIMTDVDIQYLFLMGAYRDNEVNPSHLLTLVIDDLRSQGAIINRITLAALAAEHISKLIAETLQEDIESVKELAELLVNKTGGNPFFVNEFLKKLYSDNLIQFDFSLLKWQWNLEEINNQNITDNVVDLTIANIKKLPESERQTLSLAACVGANFDLNTLEIVCEKSALDIFSDLEAAVQSGLILPTSELGDRLLIENYKFRHDRIQEAAYTLIDDESKKAVHLQIGRLLLANVSAEELPEKIFEIADHLNLARELITDESEGVELARLNLEAGKKAKASTAYAAALEQYFTRGIEMLPGNIWQEHYDLTFNLYRERSECEYICSNYDKAEELFDYILTQVKSNLERAEIQIIRMQLYDVTAKYAKIIAVGAEALESCGISLPTTEKSEILSVFDSELQLYRANLEGIKISDLINAPEMSNLEVKVCMKLLINLVKSTFFTDPDLFALICLKMVNLSLEYGNSDVLACGYAYWGSVLSWRLIEYEVGYEFGLLSLKLNETFNNLNLAALIFTTFGALINPWRSHIKKGIPYLRKGYLAGVETGNIHSFATSALHLISLRIIAAESFDSILEESSKHFEFVYKTNNYIVANAIQFHRHIILNLQGLTSDKFSFSDKDFDEYQSLQLCQETGFLSGVAIYHIFKAQILFFYEDYEGALEKIKTSDEFIVFLPGLPQQGEHYLYYSLILTTLYPRAGDIQQKEYEKVLKANQQKMKIWADNCQENFLHKYLLVEAEIARIHGKEMEALDLYDGAIASAHENEYIQNEALANELAAKFWLEKGKEEIAKIYMKNARYGYELWGAKRKVEDLEEKYPQLLTLTSSTSSIKGTKTTHSSTDSSSGSTLDLATFLKASQAISGEIFLDKLLEKLMNITLENAGAQIGYLILETEGKLRIEAVGSLETESIELFQSLTLENNLPESIINYVMRTQESVVLNNALAENDFSKDVYIQTNKPQSILCSPLINQGKIAGILYLENNLTVGAFTPERLEIFNLLSSQAAIAIENARLYSQLEDSNRLLEQKVEQRTTQLAEATQKAETANQAKSAFLANMSHELRSPLNAILGFSQLMNRSQNLPSEHQENVGIINRSGEHLLTLINQVLDLSKIEAGHITLNENNFDLYRLLDDVEDMLSLKAEDKGLQLVFERSADVPRYICTDEVKLRQVLINLLNNALKFTIEGGVCVRVKNQNLPQENELEERVAIAFEVEDTGPGIAPEEIDQLFQAFMQTSTGKKSQEGTGLGLPISRKFVQLMAGEMTVNSQVGRGTTFKFDLKVSLVESANISAKKPTNNVIALEPNQPRYRILIVDDKWESRQLLIKLLNPLGFELKEASNGQEAVEIWESWQPHLIWMDIRMPVMKGYEASQQIKSSSKGQPTSIIALTASMFEEEKAVVLSAGCDDFMRKPFRDADIFEMMKKHLGVRYIYDESTELGESELDSSRVLSLADLQKLPREWMASLELAILSLDLDSMTQVVEEIRTQDVGIANGIQRDLNNFEYDSILNLISQSREVSN